MATHRVKRGNRVYLYEYKKYREGGKVRSKYVRYKGVEGGTSTRKGPKGPIIDRIQRSPSKRAGAVRLLWHIVQDLEFVPIIDRICGQESYPNDPSTGKLLSMWAINRVLDPISATQLEYWVPTTDLPLLTGLPEEILTKDNFLWAMDKVCIEDPRRGGLIDYTREIDRALFERWREKHPLPKGKGENLAYDLTPVLFFGVTCPLAELGHNTYKIARRQVNLTLVVSKFDKQPLFHSVFPGSRHTSRTVKNLLAELQKMSVKPGTMVWDRGAMSVKNVEFVEDMKWKLICGVPKTVTAARNILVRTEISFGPETLARGSAGSAIYATKTDGRLYKKDRSVVVYQNRKRSVNDGDKRDIALSQIGEALDSLAEKGKYWSEAELHKEIKNITRGWSDYIETRVKRKGKGPRVVWNYKNKMLQTVQRLDGKWLLYSTDEGLSAKEVVNTYLEKDYIEKVFRVLKTDEKVEPVRHRLERRVRVYLFVCVLAYRIWAALRWRFYEAGFKDEAWEKAGDLLRKLERVERMEVRLGTQVRIWYLNVTKKIEDTLKKLKLSKLLREEAWIDDNV